MTSVISPRFFISWIVTLPVTVVIVGLWYMWEQQRTDRYELGEAKRGKIRKRQHGTDEEEEDGEKGHLGGGILSSCP